jgi:glycyl-tRNA synthetase beta chain
MEFLLEVGVEEMPPSHVRTAVADLKDRFAKDLGAAKIPAHELRVFGSCRRLIVVADIPEAEETREELITGPPKTAAFSADGTPTPAALGFARAKGVDVGRLEVIKTEKGEYVGFRATKRGRTAAEILAELVPRVIGTLSFPKMMRWGEGSFRFSRPIRNLLCLAGGSPVLFEIDGLRSGGVTTGHKIRAPRSIEIASFRDYQDRLRDHLVVIDVEERKSIILAQIADRLRALNAELYPDPALLDKLANDVEWPFVILGAMPEEYLSLPLEVLSTAMREGQKLFSVIRGQTQLPYFLAVADVPADPRGLIRKGHERVLKARLEDARFFWDQDVRVDLKKRIPALKHVLFQEKLGTYADKAQRLKKITAYLSAKVEDDVSVQDLASAAELCKTDLMTDMVREFPALQGRMGGLYAGAQGQPAAVVRAIYEHYQPVSLEDDVPSSPGGAILSVADKMDSIVGVVGVGIQTTGSSDPFGLRRNAQGVCKIILDRKWDFSLVRLVEKILAVYGDTLKRPKADVVAYCRDFFASRLKYLFDRQGFRYDLVNAALGAGADNIFHALLRVKALDTLKSSPQFEPFILMAKRVNNILTGQQAGSLNPDLLAETSERELYATFAIVRENVRPMIARGDFTQAQKVVFRLQPALNAFFDNVLVMAEERNIRKNRLALLQAIAKIMAQMADYSQVVVD